MTKKQFGQLRIYLTYTSTLRFITEGSQELKQDRILGGRADAEAMKGKLLSPWFSQPTFYSTQDQQPRDNGLGPPTLNTNRENALELDLIEPFPQLRLLF